jgi:hypothetical protein
VVVAIEDLKITKSGRCTVEVPGSLIRGRPLEGPQFSQSVLAGECERPIGTLGLRDAENPMDPVSYTETVPWSSITSRRVSGKTA